MFQRWPDPIGVYVGLAALALLLVTLQTRHRRIVPALRDNLVYRLVLAAIGGWLAAWFLMPVVWGTPWTRGFFLPGTIFGIFVLLPMLDEPFRHPVRATILVWAATTAHAVLWAVGVSIFETMTPRLELYLYPGRWPFWLIVIGAPSLVAFGAISIATASRVIGLHIGLFHWFLILALSAVLGFAYAFIVPNIGSDLVEWYGRFEGLLIDDLPTFLIYVVWFGFLSVFLNLGKRREIEPLRGKDSVSLGALILLTAWAVHLIYSG